MSNLLSASINLHPSKKAILLLSFLYGLGILCVIFSAIPISIKIVLIVFIFFDAHHVFKKLNTVIHLSHHANQWKIQKREGSTHEIDEQQLISFRKIVILRFKVEKSTYKTLESLFLFDDNMTRENFHYLLVQARLHS